MQQPSTPVQQQVPTYQPSTPVQQQPVVPTQPTKPTSLNVSVNPKYSPVRYSGGYYQIDISGTVTNNASWNLSYLSIYIVAYSSDGIKLQTRIAYASSLNAGETGLLSTCIMIKGDTVNDTNFTYKIEYGSYTYE